MTADTDNGRVQLEFAAAPTTVVATTNNGWVEVVVPDDGTAYRVDVQTDNGSETMVVAAGVWSPYASWCCAARLELGAEPEGPGSVASSTNPRLFCAAALLRWLRSRRR